MYSVYKNKSMRKTHNSVQKFTPFYSHLILFTSMYVSFDEVIFVIAQKPHDNKNSKNNKKDHQQHLSCDLPCLMH